MNPIAVQYNSFMENYSKTKACAKLKLIPSVIDYLWCSVKYGSSASDYFELEFYDKSGKSRSTFLTYRLKMKFFHRVNDYSKKALFDDKTKFFETFPEYIHREWLKLADASFDRFNAFVQKHSSFIAKPIAASGGKGVRLVSTSAMKEDKLRELYEALTAEGAIIEEIIEQHHMMAKLYPYSANTMRIATAVVKGEMRILGAALRCGSGGGSIDNYSAGGLAAKIDPETGIVISDATNSKHERLYKHPDTGVFFHGFQIPHWEKVLKMLEDVTHRVPGVGYTGWDVVIREDGPALIEGNFEGMIHVLQQPANQGIKAAVEQILKELK